MPSQWQRSPDIVNFLLGKICRWNIHQRQNFKISKELFKHGFLKLVCDFYKQNGYCGIQIKWIYTMPSRDITLFFLFNIVLLDDSVLRFDLRIILLWMYVQNKLTIPHSTCISSTDFNCWLKYFSKKTRLHTHYWRE